MPGRVVQQHQPSSARSSSPSTAARPPGCVRVGGEPLRWGHRLTLRSAHRSRAGPERLDGGRGAPAVPCSPYAGPPPRHLRSSIPPAPSGQSSLSRSHAGKIEERRLGAGGHPRADRRCPSRGEPAGTPRGCPTRGRKRVATCETCRCECQPEPRGQAAGPPRARLRFPQGVQARPVAAHPRVVHAAGRALTAGVPQGAQGQSRCSSPARDQNSSRRSPLQPGAPAPERGRGHLLPATSWSRSRPSASTSTSSRASARARRESRSAPARDLRTAVTTLEDVSTTSPEAFGLLTQELGAIR